MQLPETESAAISPMIFGTPDGMLGMIANLKQDAYEFFAGMQTAMAALLPLVEGVEHSKWRATRVEIPAPSAPARNFLDGDRIERFLDSKLRQMEKVAAMFNLGVRELVQRVERMQRLLKLLRLRRC